MRTTMLIILSVGLLTLSNVYGNKISYSSEFDCEITDGKVSRLIGREWNAIRDGGVSNLSPAKDYKVTGYTIEDGKYLIVQFKSNGYMYDLNVETKIKVWFDSDCDLEGDVVWSTKL